MIGPPVSMTSMPRREAVGRVHRDRADAVVAEVLLDLADEDASRAGEMPSASSGLSSRSMMIAWLISGSSSGKTASMTTPWISSIRPTLRFSVAPCSRCCSRSWLAMSVVSWSR